MTLVFVVSVAFLTQISTQELKSCDITGIRAQGLNSVVGSLQYGATLLTRSKTTPLCECMCAKLDLMGADNDELALKFLSWEKRKFCACVMWSQWNSKDILHSHACGQSYRISPIFLASGKPRWALLFVAYQNIWVCACPASRKDQKVLCWLSLSDEQIGVFQFSHVITFSSSQFFVAQRHQKMMGRNHYVYPPFS